MKYTTVATITRRTKEYGRVQQKTKIQAVIAHIQGLTQNVKRARGEMLVHVWGKVNGRRIYPFNKGYGFMGGGCTTPL